MHEAAVPPVLRSLPPFDVSGVPPMAGPPGGIGRLPLTARSSSSSLNPNETPRGGCYTARSAGGEKGTPREPQRMALGERPGTDRGSWGVTPALSPQHTARSAALSSEPNWSRTPSSYDDGLSSRSRSEFSLTQDDFAQPFLAPAALHFGTPRGLSVTGNASGADVDSSKYSIELMRNLEVMRFVIMRENGKLKEMLQQSHLSIADMNEQCLRPCPGPNIVEWCVEKVENLRDRFYRAPESCPVERMNFSLPEYPEVNFQLEFRAGAFAATACPDTEVAFELVLKVSGEACEGLELSVHIAVALEPCTALPSPQPSSVISVLRGPGEVRCSCLLPGGDAVPEIGGMASASFNDRGDGSVESQRAVCTVKIEEISWGPGSLCFSTSA